MSNFKYGWRKQPFDGRDLHYAAKETPQGLPASFSVESGMPEIWNQENLGACTAHGIGACIYHAQVTAGRPSVITPSRLFLYFNERLVEGTTMEDSGAIIRDGFKVTNRFGFVDESLWIYDISKFTQKPPDVAYQSALSNQIHYYASLDNTNLAALKTCLFHGHPFTFGFEVYTAFESYQGGVLDLPDTSKEQFLGGHCVAAVAYDDSKQAFKIRNSWGPEWGEAGSFWISYRYLTSSLASDFWMVRLK